MIEQRTAEEVVVEAQKIGALVQLATFIKASQLGAAKETGTQIMLGINNPQRTTIWINSKLIEAVLTAEFDKIGSDLEDSGVDLKALMHAEDQRFQATYMGQ